MRILVIGVTGLWALPRGDWESEMQADLDSDKPTETHRGTESGRMLGERWLVLEGRGEMGGMEHRMQMSLGYNPARDAFVDWFDDGHMWVYEGQLDTDRKILTLGTEGPDMSSMEACGPGETPPTGSLPTAKYQDIIELVSPDQDKDGNWHQFEYRRVKS
jgi:hypothetical protein